MRITVTGWIDDNKALISGGLGARWIRKTIQRAVHHTKREAKIYGVQNPVRRKIVCKISVEDM